MCQVLVAVFVVVDVCMFGLLKILLVCLWEKRWCNWERQAAGTAVSMISVYHFVSPKKFLVMILGVGPIS